MPDVRLDGRPSLQQLRADLFRSVPFTAARAAEEDEPGDGRTIDGYGAVFGSVTTIDSWEGTFDEVISPGAFRKSLRERMPIMQFDHGRHPLVGSLPLGRWDVAEEDTAGLHVVGRISDNWLMEPFRDAIRDGGVTGMSFRFTVVRDEWTDAAGKKVRDDELEELLWYGAGERGPLLRTLKELKVSEVGPVTWPAYEATSVGVRSAGDRFVIDLGHLDLRTDRARSQLARAVALADAAAATPGPRPAQTPDDSTSPGSEPRSTAGTADEHAERAPRVTEAPPAGEHSTDPWERRNRMRAGIHRIATHMQKIDSGRV